MYRDHPAVALSRYIAGASHGSDSFSWGLVLTYDADTHTATVALQPGDEGAGPLPVISSSIGWSPDLNANDQVLVAMDHGTPLAIVGVSHSTVKQPPTEAVAIEHSLWVSGQARADALELARYIELPDATPAWRGKIVLVSTTFDGDAGDADSLWICLQDAGGTLAWTQIA